MQYERIIEIAAKQYGCLSRKQALAVMSRWQWDHLVAKRFLRRVHPGVFAVTGFPVRWELTAYAAVLSLQNAALSHRAAARFWGIGGFTGPNVAISVPPNSEQRRAGVDVHKSEQLEPFVLRRHGTRVTTVARTLVDLSACMSETRLARAVDQACNQDLVTLTEIEHCLDHLVTRGRRRIGQMRTILGERNINDQKLDSFFERRVLRWIREASLPEPHAHVWVCANGSRYELDLAYPEIKLAIESDGPHHFLPSVADYDRRRDADLQLEGWVVLHVAPATPRVDVVAFIRNASSRRMTA